MKNKIANMVLVAILTIAGFAWAESIFGVVSLVPGTTTGVNWTVPDKVSDLKISSQDGVNWADIYFFQSGSVNWDSIDKVGTVGVNWNTTDGFRIQPGTTYSINNVFSKGNVLAVKAQGSTQKVKITYAQSN